jgi:Mg2+/Co2+ transporter CorB
MTSLAMDTALAISLLAIFALLLLSGFFSGSETALTAASRARIHHLARKGNKRAQAVSWLIDRREQLLGSILLGNNLVNILASSLATSVLITIYGQAGVVYATVIMTILLVIFAEILPKTYAIRHADRVALAVAPIARGIVWFFSPVVLVMLALVRVILALFGVDRKDRGNIVSAADEIRGAIHLHTSGGGIVKHDRDMIESILELSEVELSDVMVHRKNMFTIDAGAPTKTIIEQILKSPNTRTPIWRDNPDDIIGIIHVRDVLRALSEVGGDAEKLDVDALASEPWFVPETTTLREQLSAFRRRRVHFALVVDEYGALMGLVTLEDIIEEIVGEISDEYDEEEIEFRTLPDGRCVVAGTAAVRDLNRAFDWELPEEDATTVAGLVIHEARVIPEVGQSFDFFGFKFEVLRRHRNQITTLRITPPQTSDAAVS